MREGGRGVERGREGKRVSVSKIQGGPCRERERVVGISQKSIQVLDMIVRKDQWGCVYQLQLAEDCTRLAPHRRPIMDDILMQIDGMF